MHPSTDTPRREGPDREAPHPEAPQREAPHPEALHHEVRLRAAAWARRLVAAHGAGAERVVRATLRRRDLSAHERLAARFTREALADLRRGSPVRGAPDTPGRHASRGPGWAARLRALFGGRRAAEAPLPPPCREAGR